VFLLAGIRFEIGGLCRRADSYFLASPSFMTRLAPCLASFSPSETPRTMPQVIDIQQASDPQDVVHEAVRLLAAGELVGLPTETGYVVAANAADANAVAELTGNLIEGLSTEFCLAVKHAGEALDYVPDMTPLGRRLASRCWPGPVTITFPENDVGGLIRSLSEATCNAIKSENGLRLRSPAHRVLADIQRLLPVPLVLTGEVFSGDRLANTAEELPTLLRELPALVIDDGESRFGEPGTVIELDYSGWHVSRPGVVQESAIRRLACDIHLFVCTGNTCRSPLAEGMFRKMLAERLGCADDDLADHGHLVISAGLAAAHGSPASSESIELARRQGIDLGRHESQPLTEQLLEQADHVYTMTQNHRDAIDHSRPDLAKHVELLARDGSDIPDPIGGRMREYERCEQAIDRHLRSILNSMD
jgi:protein-tyrosine phosphatase